MQYSLYEPQKPHVHKPEEAEKHRKRMFWFRTSILSIALILVVWMLWRVWPTAPGLVIELGVDGELSMDGKPMGVGKEFSFPQLQIGKHMVTVKPVKPVFYITEQTERIDLQYGTKETIKMLEVASCTIDSKPQGAWVVMNHQTEGELLIGKTPIKTVIPYGYYEAILRLPGYPESRTSVLSSESSEIKHFVDFEKLALAEEKSSKLTENFIVSSLPSYAMVKIDNIEITSPKRLLLEGGYHKVCLFSGQTQVICTDVVLPTVGKPVIISWPDNITSPCLYFGEGLYPLPYDVRNITVSPDGSRLLFNTQASYVNCVDLITGRELWATKLDRAFNGLPAMILGADDEKVYGSAGIPPGLNWGGPGSTAFAISLETGSEIDIDKLYSGSALPMSPPKFQAGGSQFYGHVWKGPVQPNLSIPKGMEAVVVTGNEVKRFTHDVDYWDEADFLGVSVSAKKNWPIFVYQTIQKGYGSGFVDVHVLDTQDAKPIKTGEEDEKARYYEGSWINFSGPFPAKGVCFDGGFDTKGTFIMWNDHQIASVAYPSGKIVWKKYVDNVPSQPPTIISAKGKPVVLLNFKVSPYELQFDLYTGEQIVARSKPQDAAEAIGGEACPGGVFVLPKGKIVSGVKSDANGNFKPTWVKVYDDVLVKASPWGALVILNNTVTLLGSHELAPVMSIKLPGLGSPKEAQVFGNQNDLAIYAGTSCWIVDRYGLVKGYFANVSSLHALESNGHKALLATIGQRQVVIPWP